MVLGLLEPEAENRAAVSRILGRKLAVLGPGEVSGDGQAQARASTLPGACFFGAVEAIEDARQVLRGDTGPRVLHAYLRPAVQEAPRDGYGSPFGGVAHGVIEERGQDLTGAARVSVNGELLRHLNLETDALLGRSRKEAPGRLGRYGRQIEGFGLHVEPAGVESGQDQEVGEQRVHPVDLGELVFDDLPVLRVGRVTPYHVRVDPDECQRGF